MPEPPEPVNVEGLPDPGTFDLPPRTTRALLAIAQAARAERGTDRYGTGEPLPVGDTRAENPSSQHEPISTHVDPIQPEVATLVALGKSREDAETMAAALRMQADDEEP